MVVSRLWLVFSSTMRRLTIDLSFVDLLFTLERVYSRCRPLYVNNKLNNDLPSRFSDLSVRLFVVKFVLRVGFSFLRVADTNYSSTRKIHIFTQTVGMSRRRPFQPRDHRSCPRSCDCRAVVSATHVSSFQASSYQQISWPPLWWTPWVDLLGASQRLPRLLCRQTPVAEIS